MNCVASSRVGSSGPVFEICSVALMIDSLDTLHELFEYLDLSLASWMLLVVRTLWTNVGPCVHAVPTWNMNIDAHLASRVHPHFSCRRLPTSQSKTTLRLLMAICLDASSKIPESC